MTRTRLASRTVTVSAAFVLAFGAAGVAASAAFADDATTSAPISVSVQDEPTFTLVDNGAGSFSLAIVIPGTSVAIDYTVDADGGVTGATTSTAGAGVTFEDDEITVTLTDGRVVAVEVGKAGEVDEIEVEGPDDDADENDSNDADVDENDSDENDSQDVSDENDSQDASDENDSQDASDDADAQDASDDADAQDASDDSADEVEVDSEDDSADEVDSSDDSDSGSNDDSDSND